MSFGITAIDETVNGQVVFEFTDSIYKGCKFHFEGLRFAEKENDDGSLNLSFDYTITNPDVFSLDNFGKEDFETTLGDFIMFVLEEQIKNGSPVFKGGVDE